MLGRSFVFALSLSVAALARGAGVADVAPPEYEWNGVERIVAIGDVHGAYESFVAVLRASGLVDEKRRWIGGRAHLVQTGDVLDRGPESRRTMELLMKLEKEAERAGGRVHALIGNHEAMNVVGILDDVSPEEFASYVDADSAARREQWFLLHYASEKKKAKESGTMLPSEDEARRAFESRYPLGYVEHRLAFAPDGRYGRWILGHDVAVLLNGVVFSHGDWSEKMSSLGIAHLNRRVRDELSGRADLAGGVTFDPESPLQYRGLSKTPLESERPEVSRILANLGASRMVVGHTVTRGVIEPRFGGRHVSIDVGMLRLYDGGHRVALEIREGKLKAIHPRGAVEIPLEVDESRWLSYLTQVAAVDPGNPAARATVAAPEGVHP